MPYWRLFYHFVWGTKYGEPLIVQDFQEALYKAIAAKVISLEGIAHAVGGISDHVHLVVSVPPKIALATFIGQVKGNASHFVNHEIGPGYLFGWQDEYGVLSFGERHLSWVVGYTLNQAQHHGQSTTLARLERMSGS
jgi:putative transposase